MRPRRPVAWVGLEAAAAGFSAAIGSIRAGSICNLVDKNWGKTWRDGLIRIFWGVYGKIS
jgi:hypothetical protein